MAQVPLDGSIYSLEAAAESQLETEIRKLQARVEDLRAAGILNSSTLEGYYGRRRIEQVAESNALEGSTLDVGETELAVLKGVTLTGHDPAYQNDARALDKALQRLVEMARDARPTDVTELKELHTLILEGRPGAGMFRSQPVRIGGSSHRPPRGLTEVLDAMQEWERWSQDTAEAPAIVRGTVLHAWLAHIHPFLDGNGRTARAITNLEMVRKGYPPLILKRRDRVRYLDALAESDAGGNLGPLFDLLIGRASDALTGLELAASKEQGYNRAAQRSRREQERRVQIWNTAVELLYRILVDRLEQALEACGGTLSPRIYKDSIELDDYVALCAGETVPRTWLFELSLSAPGVGALKRLAWAGYRSQAMRRHVGEDGGSPAVFWSVPNPAGYPPWLPADAESPGAREFTNYAGQGDKWIMLSNEGQALQKSTVELTDAIVNGFMHRLLRPSQPPAPAIA